MENNPANELDPLGLFGGKSFWRKLWDGDYFGTQRGEYAAEYYARRYDETGNPIYLVGGVTASLWTPKSWKETALTLATAGVGSGAGAAQVAAERGSLTAGENLAINRFIGKSWELASEETFKQCGYKILGRQVSVQTSAGRRVIDLLVEDPFGKVTAIECKTGRAVRSALQVIKDELIEQEGGVLVGKNAQEAIKYLGKTLLKVSTEVF